MFWKVSMRRLRLYFSCVNWEEERLDRNLIIAVLLAAPRSHRIILSILPAMHPLWELSPAHTCRGMRPNSNKIISTDYGYLACSFSSPSFNSPISTSLHANRIETTCIRHNQFSTSVAGAKYSILDGSLKFDELTNAVTEFSALQVTCLNAEYLPAGFNLHKTAYQT